LPPIDILKNPLSIRPFGVVMNQGDIIKNINTDYFDEEI
jgi:hypothetical protein